MRKSYLIAKRIQRFLIFIITPLLLTGCMSIQEAARQGDIEHIKFLLALGTNINSGTWFGDQGTALHRACSAGQVETVKFLLDHDANINAGNEAAELPIHYAAENGHAEIVKILLDNGSIVNPTLGRTNRSALNIAARHGYIDVAKVLLDYGADVNTFEGKYEFVSWPSGDTPLHEAVNGGHIEMAELLISKGANVNSRGAGRCTPLHKTLSSDNSQINQAKIKIRQILQNYGADPTFTCDRHQPSHIDSRNKRNQPGFLVELLTGDLQ